ncbi:MAG: valine--tRNA ligase [Candidatus Sungbacteria bacterium]|nr:valine--tRNA ligase [Candidatus Sungbacteria bacterium]
MPATIASQYRPKDTEDAIYRKWEQSGLFNPDECVKKGFAKKSARAFSMVLPPPNVTGTLHLGHAFEDTLQDIMVRFHRMAGERTLWIPGTDHAAIATQTRVEDTLYKKERKTRHDLGREEFLKRVEQFAKESHDTIVHQVKKMGASLDWSREAYTLDKERNLAVRTAFERMYNAGLIYRGNRIVNWDPKLKTTVSDDEIEWKEEQTPFYYLQYGPFVIGTARPETKFGDKYVVMHPGDKRYAQYKHGQKIALEWINGPVRATVIKDKAVDKDFGTGVMTITPWHDAVDFDIAERRGLDKEQVIDVDGKLLPIAGEFAGLHIKKARAMIVEKLRTKGLLMRTDEQYTHRIATNSRGGGVIEPQIMHQWFVGVNREFPMPHSRIKGIRKGQRITLKKLMLAVVKNGQIQILPRRFEKIYLHWVNNLHDWCISRQLWYGHRIPAWYKDGETYCGATPPKDKGWKQDPDTLDTWFSSGMWTFSTLGWPKTTPDLKNYHPTSVISPGYEILQLWVSRMILMSAYLLGEIPFHRVYFHGIVRDKDNRKFSKSLNNGIDPLEVIAAYGCDALRMSMTVGIGPGSDVRFDIDKVKAYRNFANKIWNATRFVLMHVDAAPSGRGLRYTNQEQAMRAKLASLVSATTADLELFRLHQAADRLYHFFWHYYADKVLEEVKHNLEQQENLRDKKAAAALLWEFHTTLLKLLHPFMPYVTEAAWEKLPHQKSTLLMVAPWPIKLS